MSTTIAERPHLFSFSLNEIRYVLNVTDPTAAGCAVDIELYYHDIDAVNGILFKSFTLTPSLDGSIYCHIRDYIDSLLKLQLPVITGATIQPVKDQVKYFYIKYREITKADPDTAWLTDDQNKRIAVMGGVEQRLFKRNNFFVSYLVDTKAFLTWQPSNRFVFEDERHYLTFLLTTPADFTVKVHTVFTDLTSHDTTIPFVAGSNVLFRIKAGAKDLGLPAIDITRTLYYYEIQVNKTADNGLLASPHRFYLEYRPLYAFTDILFFNSISGLDAVRVKGQVDWSIENTGDDVEHITGSQAYNTDRPQVQYSQANQLKKDNFKGDAGWRRTPAQQEALVELLLSKGRYEIVDGRWIGIVNLRKNLDLRSSVDKKWSFPVEWSYGYSDRVFTPKWLSLGAGTGDVADVPATPGCVAVTFPVGLSLPDGRVNQPYFSEIVLNGTAPFRLSAIVKPAWMNLFVLGNVVRMSGIPDATVVNTPVSFTISNCGIQTANYIDNISIGTEVISVGKPINVVNHSAKAIQLQSNGESFPAIKTVNGFSANITSGTSINVDTVPGGSGPITFRVEFRTVVTDPSIFNVVVNAGDGIALSSDPDNPVTGVNVINYIIITLLE